MFFFKRSGKQKVSADLLSFMQTDIHSHLIPGVDDGSQDSDTTIQFIEQLQEMGIQKIITTPHVMMDRYPNSITSLQPSYDSVNKILNASGNQIPFSFAAEYYLDEQFPPLLQQPLLTVAGNKVLVEISFISPPPQLLQWLFDIQTSGYQPIMAHPERYKYYHDDAKYYHQLKESGCLLQVNLLSLTGYYGRSVQKAATMLLENQLADLIGTDLHHEKHLQAIKDISDNKKLRRILDSYSFMNRNLED